MSVRTMIVAAAACAVLGGAAAGVPASAGAAAGGRAAATPSAIGIGTLGMTTPFGRDFAAAGGPPTSAECLASLGVACYSSSQLERAYDLPPLYAKGLTSRGRTIVIVDPYGRRLSGTTSPSSTTPSGCPHRRLSGSFSR